MSNESTEPKVYVCSHIASDPSLVTTPQRRPRSASDPLRIEHPPPALPEDEDEDEGDEDEDEEEEDEDENEDHRQRQKKKSDKLARLAPGYFNFYACFWGILWMFAIMFGAIGTMSLYTSRV